MAGGRTHACYLAAAIRHFLGPPQFHRLSHFHDVPDSFLALLVGYHSRAIRQTPQAHRAQRRMVPRFHHPLREYHRAVDFRLQTLEHQLTIVRSRGRDAVTNPSWAAKS
jgi:hypothetical protein